MRENNDACLKRWDRSDLKTVNKLLRAIDDDIASSNSDTIVTSVVLPAVTIGAFSLSKIRQRYPFLTSLDMSKVIKHGDSAVKCSGGLTRIVLPYHSKMTDTGFFNIVQPQASLVSIELVNCVFVTNISIQMMLETCTLLRQIKLLKCKWVDHHTMKILCGVDFVEEGYESVTKRFKKTPVPLEHIEVTESDLLYGNSMQYLKHVRDSLEAINLTGCGMLDGISATYICLCTELVCIDMECTQIDDESIRVISNGCKCLKQLGIGSCERLTALSVWWLTPKPIALRLGDEIKSRFSKHRRDVHQSDVMLTQLSIRACRGMDNDLVFPIIDSWPRLVHLNCGGINGGYTHLKQSEWEEIRYGVLHKRGSTA